MKTKGRAKSKASSSASSVTFSSRAEDIIHALPDVDPANLVPLTTIGKGCFGKVVLARHENEVVAVKVAGKHMLRTPADVNKAVTEVKIMRSVCSRSPFLCESRGAFQMDNAYIVTMNYASGGDLYYHLVTFGALPENRVRLIAMEVLLGLQQLHLRGIVHRDLKPENILITGEGRVQITDFGLSRFLPRLNCSDEAEGRHSFSSFASDIRNEPSGNFGCFSWLSRKKSPPALEVAWGTTRTKCGTPTYRCPAAVIGNEYGLEADFWALGCILYECLTGTPAFTGKTLKELNQAILHSEPKYRGLEKYIQPRTRMFIQDLLIKDRTKRLGYGVCGVRDVKNHFYFTDFSKSRDGYTWEKVASLEAPPVVYLSEHGHVRDPASTEFFAEEFTSLDVIECIPRCSAKDLDGYLSIPNDVLENKFIVPAVPEETILNPRTSPVIIPKTLSTKVA